MRDLYHRGCAAIAACGVALAAQAANVDTASRDACKQALPQVAQGVAGLLEPVRRDSHCVAGDFNGDGKPDLLMVVKVLVAKVPAAAGVKVTYPFHDRDGEKGRLQLLALHSTAGAGAGEWSRYEKLLLDGSSPILVLRHADGAGDLRRVTRQSKEVKALQVPVRRLRGEGVLLGTEAVDAVLYWDGKTYVLHEDPAGP
ncbi:hypothetical protein [Pseudoduganella chitinolytica]|uniref:VCBS repeat-containing protein n=1 Tax=Pseudoduganella chitinolytica TaxID=34070 RepID=A0ABY8B9K9_9BURK|nr:hypothetical protein [Pseudoduganella chitinolytica]WEF31686.1 hypothetical protein PX653_19825 [Pseudoduganella chitinolytica]